MKYTDNLIASPRDRVPSLINMGLQGRSIFSVASFIMFKTSFFFAVPVWHVSISLRLVWAFSSPVPLPSMSHFLAQSILGITSVRSGFSFCSFFGFVWNLSLAPSAALFSSPSATRHRATLIRTHYRSCVWQMNVFGSLNVRRRRRVLRMHKLKLGILGRSVRKVHCEEMFSSNRFRCVLTL